LLKKKHAENTSRYDVLSEDHRVLFAFLYGSVAETGQGNDIDIAVYVAPNVDFYQLSAEMKIALHKRIGLSPDAFDVRVLNGVAERGDVFGLLYLKNVLGNNRLLIDRDPDARSEFLERYGMRYDMKADPIRIKRYLTEIRRYSLELNQLIEQNQLTPDSVPLKAAKYIIPPLS